MEISNLQIRVGMFEDFRRDILDSAVKPPRGFDVLYLSPKQLTSFLSEQRVKLLKAIRENPQSGVVELAAMLGRKQEAVSRDVAHFRSLGLLVDGEKRLAMIPSKPKRSPFSLNIVL